MRSKSRDEITMKKTIAMAGKRSLKASPFSKQVNRLLKTKKNVTNVAHFLNTNITNCKKKEYGVLIKLLTTYKHSAIDNIVKRITKRETPYGHLRWLYNEQLKLFKQNETMYALFCAKIMILDWQCNNQMPNKTELSNYIQSSGKLATWLNLYPKPEETEEQILKKCCERFFKFDTQCDWLNQKIEFLIINLTNYIMTVVLILLGLL